MKTLFLSCMICVISNSYSQSFIYDSIKQQTNYFSFTHKMVGYTKKVNGTTKAYDMKDNQIMFETLIHSQNQNDDGSDFTIGGSNPEPVIKSMPTVEYKMPEMKVKSVKWNEVFKRWDYIYGY